MALEISPSKIPLYKLILHILQVAISFICWILEIIVFSKGDSTSLNGWTFGVCFLSAPAWIYLVMAPRWPRTRKLAEPKAMLVIDGLFAVLWLTAFSTQAAYNTGGHCGSACGPSKAIVFLGVVETVLWTATSFLSLMTVQYHEANGVLPGYDGLRGTQRMNAQNIDPDKAAFSTAPHDEEAYAPLGRHDEHDDDEEQEFNASPYGAAAAGSAAGRNGSMSGAGLGYGERPSPYNSHTGHSRSNLSVDHAANNHSSSSLGRPSGGLGAYDSSYGGASGGRSGGSPQRNPFEDHGEFTGHLGGSAVPAGSHIYAPPAVHDEELRAGRPVKFPAGNYGGLP